MAPDAVTPLSDHGCDTTMGQYTGNCPHRHPVTIRRRDGIPYPSAKRPEQNRHRLADGRQGSTVRSILENPRYTGYAVFGRWTKHETLLDPPPDDVAAGRVVRLSRSTRDRIVRSRHQAHPAIVSVEEFTQVQLLRRSKGAGGLATASKADRGGRSTARSYLLRGRIRCGVCHRRMQGATIRKGAYYRCTRAPSRQVRPSWLTTRRR
ncbi:recombinase family protein [Saccharomonospora sp. NPDC006951]